jgi:hypothetical protein
VIKFSYSWTFPGAVMFLPNQPLESAVAITEDLGTIADVPPIPDERLLWRTRRSNPFPGHEKEQGSDKHE